MPGQDGSELGVLVASGSIGTGGRRLPEYASGGFLVMADPEGNEFCVIPDGPLEVDDEGCAHYLE